MTDDNLDAHRDEAKAIIDGLCDVMAAHLDTCYLSRCIAVAAILAMLLDEVDPAEHFTVAAGVLDMAREFIPDDGDEDEETVQ